MGVPEELRRDRVLESKKNILLFWISIFKIVSKNNNKNNNNSPIDDLVVVDGPSLQGLAGTAGNVGDHVDLKNKWIKK